MVLSFVFQHSEFEDAALNASISGILGATLLLSMATVRPDGKSHINTAFFAYDDALRLFLITGPNSAHGKHFSTNPSVAVTVFDSHQKFWTELRCLQLFGNCRQTPLTKLPHALSRFIKRFPVFSELVKSPADFARKAVGDVRLHTITVERLKLFDEPTFGEEVFIDLQITETRSEL